MVASCKGSWDAQIRSAPMKAERAGVVNRFDPQRRGVTNLHHHGRTASRPQPAAGNHGLAHQFTGIKGRKIMQVRPRDPQCQPALEIEPDRVCAVARAQHLSAYEAEPFRLIGADPYRIQRSIIRQAPQTGRGAAGLLLGMAIAFLVPYIGRHGDRYGIAAVQQGRLYARPVLVIEMGEQAAVMIEAFRIEAQADRLPRRQAGGEGVAGFPRIGLPGGVLTRQFRRIDPDQARTMVYKLSRILRRLLKKQESLTPLREELSFIDDYLAILASGENPRLTFAARPGDHYDLKPNQADNILTNDRIALAAKIADLQAKVDQAAAITG